MDRFDRNRMARHGFGFRGFGLGTWPLSQVDENFVSASGGPLRTACNCSAMLLDIVGFTFEFSPRMRVSLRATIMCERQIPPVSPRIKRP